MSLTKEQLKLIEVTWTPVKEDLQKAGNDMFFKLFEVAPHTKQLFPFRDVAIPDLINDESFNKHALGVMETIDAAVGLLKDNNVEDLSEILMELGAVHMMKNSSISKDYFKPVGEALVHVLSLYAGSALTPEAISVWLSVYTFVQEKMGEGMDMDESDDLLQ